MKQRFIVYRDTSMTKDWPEKIAVARSVQSYTLNGRPVPRIRYGSESDDWGADKRPCRDCSALKGEFHVTGCDVEECPVCHIPVLSCDCPFDERG